MPPPPSFSQFIVPKNSTKKPKEKTEPIVIENFKHPFMESLKEITKGIEHLIKQSKLNNITDPQFTVINNEDLYKLLKISSKTASIWRGEGKLRYSKIKGRIFYKLSDIHKLINDNSYIGKKKV